MLSVGLLVTSAVSTTKPAATHGACWKHTDARAQFPALSFLPATPSGKTSAVAFCKLLTACPEVGTALLGIKKNCTMDHSDPDALGEMCEAETCAPAVEKFFSSMPKNMWLNAFMDGEMGFIRRRSLAGVPATALPATALDKDEWSDIASKMSMKDGVFETAASKMNDCLTEAGIDDKASLDLPISIDDLATRFFSYERIQSSLCSRTVFYWMRTRFAYYSGYRYATKSASAGTPVGVIIAIVIGVANLVCLCSCCTALVVCIKKRACYRCMSVLAPSTLECLEEIGCGPSEEDREAWGELSKNRGSEMTAQ